MSHVPQRITELALSLCKRVREPTMPEELRVFRVATRQGLVADAQTWAAVERRVLVAILDELVVQVNADWRNPAVRNASYAARYVQEARRVIGAMATHPVACALSLFDSHRDDCVNDLRRIQLDDPDGYRQHACNAARAALCLHRDPLTLWPYMLEQLWLSAHEATGGEKGMAERLLSSLTTIFKEAL